MILPVQRRVHEAIADAIRRTFALTDVPAFAVEVPPTRALGDLAVTVAFQLARTLRKAPRAIVQELAAAIGTIPGVTQIDATPNGYLNLYLDRPAFLVDRIRGSVAPVRADPAAAENHRRTTAINPNKAAHIGHLRNAARRFWRHAGARAPRRAAGRFRTIISTTRRPGRRHHRRFPGAEHRDRDRPRARPTARASTTTAGTSYSRVTEWAYDRAAIISRRARERCTISSTAATNSGGRRVHRRSHVRTHWQRWRG